MDAAVLIGNGLNKCYSTDISWNDLLCDIANEHNVVFNKGNPFPLEFESITNQILKKDKSPSKQIYMDIKRKISETLINRVPVEQSIHESFVLGLPANHFLTTNYDYMLERVVQPYGVIKHSSPIAETKYSLYRSITIGDKTFHHIHGEAKSPSTICLGYEHYAGYLAKMREYLKANPSIYERVKGNLVPLDPSWLNLFFTHDIYIVGLELDTCEIDLWWLLTYRAYLYYSNDSGLRKMLRNKVVIYFSAKDENREKEILLNNLHVECRPMELLSGSYMRMYGNIKSDIERSIYDRRFI